MGGATAVAEKKAPGQDYKTGANYPIKITTQLRFTISFYNTYENYAWTRFYHSTDYGEIGHGLLYGDRSSISPMQNGYVYVFKNKDLTHAFVVTDGQYQRVAVSQSDVTLKNKIGGARPYMAIDKYFPKNDIHKDKYYVVVSDIPLSKERLFTSKYAIAQDPSKRGKDMTISRSNLRSAAKDTRSGPQILADYRKRKPTPDLLSYDFQHKLFDKVEGFNLLTPNVAAEARRRNNLYRDRLRKYNGWLNGKKRTEEAFLAQAVDSIMKQDAKKKSYIDNSKLDAWKKKDTEQYRLHFFPVHYAIEDVIRWLDDDKLKELLRDYSYGDDKHQQDGATLYGDAVRDVHFTQAGARYLKKEYDDSQSYFNQSTRLLQLKPNYVDSGLFTNAYVEIRKWSNFVFAFMEEFAAVIVAKEGNNALKLISDFTARKINSVLRVARINPIRYLNESVDIVRTEEVARAISGWPDTPTGKGVLTFIEAGNVALAIWGMTKSQSGADYVKNGLNLIGASLDFSSSNWIITGAIKNKLAERGSVIVADKVIHGMVLVSGIIDCVLGVWEAVNAYREGEIDVMIGWSIFALGGAIIAVGAGIKIAGAKATVASGGTLAKPGVVVILAGLLVEAVGLLVVFIFNNDEIEDWMTQCMFGTRPQKKSAKQQIQSLNDILCKFEVEGEFKEIKGKFRNTTYVTFIIKPRVITERSRISFTRVSAIAEARVSEYIFGNRADRAVGGAGSEKPVIYLNSPGDAQITRKDGRIVEVRKTLRYDMDIDRVKGKIRLDMNNGTLQGYTKSFEISV